MSAESLRRHVNLCLNSPAVGDDVKQLCLWIKRELELESEVRQLRDRDRKMRDAIAKAGFGVMETSGAWSLHCTTEAAKEAEQVERRIISENIQLEIEVARLKRELAKATTPGA